MRVVIGTALLIAAVGDASLARELGVNETGLSRGEEAVDDVSSNGTRFTDGADELSPAEMSASLVYCLDRQDISCLEQAIDKGADINAAVGGRTPLQHAIMTGNDALVRRLVNAGAELGAPGSSSDAVSLALTLGDPKMIEAIVPDPIASGRALILAGAQSGDLSLVEQGVSLGGQTTAEEFEDAPLTKAIANGSLDVAEFLLRNGATSTLSQGPALHVAVMSGQVDMVALLIAAGADPNTHGHKGLLPLTLASAAHDTGMVRLLLGSDADPKARNTDGSAPAEVAAALGYNDIVDLLGGIPDPEPTDIFSFVYKGDASKVRDAIAAGADPNITGPDGRPILHLAALLGNPDVVDVLIQAGAKVEARALDASNVMHLMCLIEDVNAREEIARLLLQNGADALLTEGDYTGRTPVVDFAKCEPFLHLIGNEEVLTQVDPDGVTLAMAAVMEKNLSLLDALSEIQSDIASSGSSASDLDIYRIPLKITLGDIARSYFPESLLLLPNDRPISFNVRHEMSKEDVMSMQEALRGWGYYTGSVDGVMGAGTATALGEFFEDRSQELALSDVYLAKQGIPATWRSGGGIKLQGDLCEMLEEDGVVYCVESAAHPADRSANGLVYDRGNGGNRKLYLTGPGGLATNDAKIFTLRPGQEGPGADEQTSPGAAYEPSQVVSYRVKSDVQDGYMNVRARPAISAEVISRISAGDIVRGGECVKGEGARLGWCQVFTSTGEGWIAKSGIDTLQ